MYGLLNMPVPDVRAATGWYRRMEADGADPDQVRHMGRMEWRMGPTAGQSRVP